MIPQLKMKFRNVDLNVRSSLISATIEESVYNGTAYSVRFVTPGLSDIDALIANDSDDKHFGELSIGHTYSDSGRVKWRQPAYKVTGNLTRLGLTTNQLVGVFLRGYCWGYYRMSFCRHKAYMNKTITEMVKKIAEEDELECGSDDVEDMQEKFTLYQCGMSDWDFMNELSARASCHRENQDRSDFYWYVDSGKTLRFVVPRVNKAPSYQFAFGQYQDGSVPTYPIFRMKVDYDEPGIVRNGTFYVRGIGYDPITKESIDKDAEDRLNPFPVSADAAVLPIAPYDPQWIISCVSPDPEDFSYTRVDSRVLSAWQDKGHGLFRVSLSTLPVVDLPLLSMVKVNIPMGDGRQHFLSGSYIVYKITHKLSSSKWNTILGLERRGHATKG